MAAVSTVLVVTLTGCYIVESLVVAGVLAGGAGTYLYMSGAEEELPVPLNEAVIATTMALEEIGDGVIEQEVATDKAKLESRFDDGTKISVKLKASSAKVTTAKVWVGTFGDRDRSLLVLEKIDGKLEAAREAAVAMPETAGAVAF
jgi:hypothetical protein